MIAALQDDLARLLLSPGAPGYLRNELAHALGAAKVGTQQTAVHIEYDRQGEVAKVVALGNHLGAYQNTRGTLVNPFQFIG